jgi:hypothetical protein
MTYLVKNCEIALNIREDLIAQVGFPIPHLKLTKKQREKWYEEYQFVLDQIEPDQHIQYVYVNDPNVADYLLDLEVIKPTKRVGKERYIVDKTKVFASWEPCREWLNSLSDIEFNEYIEAFENDDLLLVVPNEV